MRRVGEMNREVGGEERDERGSEFAKHALENVRRVE
jgi:hypothetical protein